MPTTSLRETRLNSGNGMRHLHRECLSELGRLLREECDRPSAKGRCFYLIHVLILIHFIGAFTSPHPCISTINWDNGFR